MVASGSGIARHLRPTIGFAASLLAVWCQVLLLATLSLTPLAMAADPVGSAPICHTDDGTPPATPQPGHPAHDCARCVLCLTHASPVAVLASPPMLPGRQIAGVLRLDMARPRAPPVRLVAAAQPRGPPAPI